MQLDELDGSKTVMQNVKQRFFALRNGVVADTLRRYGSPYRIVFGLNVPQLRELAAVFGPDGELAEALWDNVSTRESRLLAPMLVDVGTFGIGDARRWLRSLTDSAEEADMLCHSLLRKTPFVADLVAEYANSDEARLRYVALRLAFGLLRESVAVGELARKELERNCDRTAMIARQLLDESASLPATGRR